MEWFLKDSINKELNKGNKIIADLHGFMENRPCQISLVSFLWYYESGWRNEVLQGTDLVQSVAEKLEEPRWLLCSVEGRWVSSELYV